MSVPSSQISPPPEAARQTYPFTLADLPYAYDALEPHLDQKTLQIHHRGHHATYVKKLNEALAKHQQLHKHTLADLLRDVDRLPADIRTAVINNGGGHMNHDIFWNSMTPRTAQQPEGALAAAIARDFGSFEEFRKKFSASAAGHFASGWVALSLDVAAKRLEVSELHEHTVLAPGAKETLLILDVWEHAYYVKYQNRRAEFIEAWWNVVNWPRAAEVFRRAGAGG
ncbi:MAG TPA: superoxide dismutase [Steroidobacteraceae bacterium]|nr:superoxide dismutase [Steroidobacteraceae bacterium]